MRGWSGGVRRYRDDVGIGEQLWDLLGNWSGTEEQSASPWSPASTTRAMLTFKLDLAGTAVIQDYRQVRDDRAEFGAHGVFLAVDDEVLWWLFDTMGQAPEPGRGRWSDQALELTRTSPRGSAYHRFEVEADHLAYAIDLERSGAGRTPFLRGRYERISGH